MRSTNVSLKLQTALLDSIPKRVNMLRREIGYMTRNAYIVGLIRTDLAKPPAEIPLGHLLVRSALFEQDLFDDELLKRWATRDEHLLEAKIRRAA